MNIKSRTLDHLRREENALWKFLRTCSSKIEHFPAMVFPVVREDLDQRLIRVPVASWADVGAIESWPSFVGWAANPYNGVVNIVIQ